MPRGFPNIPSASDLPEKLLVLVPDLLDRLKRAKGWVTSTRIIEKYKKLGTKVKGPDVRAMVHYLVVEMGEPIGSGSDGYKYCEDEAEINATIDHLVDRENAIRAKRMALQRHIQRRTTTGQAEMNL